MKFMQVQKNKIWGSVESNRPNGEYCDPRAVDEYLKARYCIRQNGPRNFKWEDPL